MKAVHAGQTHTFTGLWCLLAVVAGLLRSSNAHAQTVQQTFQLEVGWNAVYVEVDPDPSDLDVLLDGLAVESVWVREENGRRVGSVPCADAPDDSVCLGSTDTGWRVWFPPDQPQRAIRLLRSLGGGQVYLEGGTSVDIKWKYRENENDHVLQVRDATYRVGRCVREDLTRAYLGYYIAKTKFFKAYPEADVTVNGLCHVTVQYNSLMSENLPDPGEEDDVAAGSDIMILTTGQVQVSDDCSDVHKVLETWWYKEGRSRSRPIGPTNLCHPEPRW